jgi:hypothetical protein
MRASKRATNVAAIWEDIQLQGNLSPAQARALLKLQFSENDITRMRELSAKARAGSLSSEEGAAIDVYEKLVPRPD